jgi:hypothetical protein
VYLLNPDRGMQLALWKTWPDLLGVPLTLAWGWGGAMACAADISQEVRSSGWGGESGSGMCITMMLLKETCWRGEDHRCHEVKSC